ncbi:MAG: NYN domain-containing protein [Anaerolineae bacterium]|nr:NYN domain-containing protein [Anaerolineae bacterium]
MPFLIDGHNLIGKMPGLSLADPDDEAKLVQQVRRYCLRHRRKAVVVFDAGLSGGVSRSLSTPEVEVVFASGRESADAVIRSRLRRAKDPRGWTLVSSDRGLQRVAASVGARVVSSEAFAAMLTGSPAHGESPEEEKPAGQITEVEVQEWLELFRRRRKR